METLTDVVQLDLVPLVAAALKETARLTAAVEGAGALTQSLSVTAVGERLVQAVISLVHGTDAAFWDARGRLTIQGSGPSTLLREPCDARLHRVVEEARSTGNRFWTPDLTNDPRLAQPEAPRAEETPDPPAGLAVPGAARGRPRPPPARGAGPQRRRFL